jgi:hypothetical protein
LDAVGLGGVISDCGRHPMGTTSSARMRVARPALAAMLLTFAAIAWLSTGSASLADSATQPQGASAAVATTIAWGSAGGCTQNMPTAAFGTLAAGASNTLTGFVGCVTSNAKWNVATRMSTPLTSTDDGSTINGSAIKLANTAVPSGATNSCTTAAPCTLSATPTTDTTILTGAPKSARQFEYSLTLTVPATATGGSYTNGTLTFTASN